MFSLFRLTLVVLIFSFFSSPLTAATQGQVLPEAVKASGLRVYFDVNVGVPHKLEIRLMLINKTYDQLLQLGHQPEFVVGFRSTASYFVTKGDEYVEPEELVLKKKIHQWVKTLKSKGIRIEQCLLAADFVDIEHEDFLSEMALVKNGYVSMIIYQSQGFAHVSMD
ncbi:MAG: hypothetical protein ABFS09_02840 [Thermodesulfobacteriota bacterium]